MVANSGYVHGFNRPGPPHLVAVRVEPPIMGGAEATAMCGESVVVSNPLGRMLFWQVGEPICHECNKAMPYYRASRVAGS